MMINLSAEPTNKLYSWLPHDLEAEEIVILPDACPGKSPLPTGTVVKLNQVNWRKFAVSDVGCGMRLLRSDLDSVRLDQWNRVADLLKANKGQLGDLGGGNHFLDALLPYSGTRVLLPDSHRVAKESGLVDAYVDQPGEFDEVFRQTVRWAFDNRSGVQEALERVLGQLEVVLDLPHNTYETLPDETVIIRKGTVKVMPGDLNIIPSNLGGDIALVRARKKVGQILNSLSHGTGRIVHEASAKSWPRAKLCSPASASYAAGLHPGCVTANRRAVAYRDLDECLDLLQGYIEMVERFSVIAYMGHL